MNIAFLTFFTSILLSITSGFCTVIGIGNIFTSAPITTMVIASTIEFGRVVLIYVLHHFWKTMPMIKKIPGILMLIIAMSLSALGVFGFFANAYSAKTKEVIPIEYEIKNLESNIPIYQSEIDLNNKQIVDIQKVMSSSSMDKAIEKYIEKEYVTKALNVKKDLQKQISTLTNNNKELNTKIIDIKKKITELQKESEEKAPSIAHLKYFAKLLNTNNDTAIITFIVMIMLVFDTLAMYLMVTSDWIKMVSKETIIEPIQETIKPKRTRKKHSKKSIETNEPTEKIIEVIEDIENLEKIPEGNEIIEDNKNNIENRVSKLVKLLLEDDSVIDNPSFIKSLSITPMIVNRLEKELGSDSEIIKKIKHKLKK